MSQEYTIHVICNAPRETRRQMRGACLSWQYNNAPTIDYIWHVNSGYKGTCHMCEPCRKMTETWATVMPYTDENEALVEVMDR